MRMPILTKRSQGAPSVVTPERAPNREKPTKGVYVQLIPPEFTLMGKFIFPMQSMKGIYNVRLLI